MELHVMVWLNRRLFSLISIGFGFLWEVEEYLVLPCHNHPLQAELAPLVHGQLE